MNVDPEGYFTEQELYKKRVFAKLVEKYQLYDVSTLEHFSAFKYHLVEYETRRVARHKFNNMATVVIYIIMQNGIKSRDIIKFITGTDLVGIIAENIYYIKEKHWSMILLITIHMANHPKLIQYFEFLNKLALDRSKKLPDNRQIAAMSFIQACRTCVEDTKDTKDDNIIIPKSLVQQVPDMETPIKTKNKITLTLSKIGSYPVKINDMPEGFVVAKISFLTAKRPIFSISHSGARHFSTYLDSTITYYHLYGQTAFELTTKGKVKITIKKVLPLDGSDYTLYPGCFVFVGAAAS